jgi:hypothetical protein
MKPKIHDDQTINMIRGKNLVKKATPEDVWVLISHIDGLETLLDEGDENDAFGTEGWRHRAGIGE